MYLYLPKHRLGLYAAGAIAAILVSFVLGHSVHAITFPASSASQNPKNINQEMIIDRLEAIKELHTAVATIQTVVSVEEENVQFGINIGSKKMLYVAVGNVRAGVDLRKLSPNAIKIVDGKLDVALPEAEILDIKLDLERSYVYDVQKRLWAPAGTGLQGQAERMAYAEVKKSAIDCGVLELAEDQAYRALEMLN